LEKASQEEVEVVEEIEVPKTSLMTLEEEQELADLMDD